MHTVCIMVSGRITRWPDYRPNLYDGLYVRVCVCACVCACVRHVCIRILLASHQHAASRRLPGGLDMSVVVLTMGYWPTYTPMTVHIPQQVSAVCACMHVCV